MDRRAVALAVLVILAVSVTLTTVVVVGAAGTGGGGTDVVAVTTSDETQSSGFDRSVVQITVAEDGSATWTFRYERTLESEDEVAQFEEYAERVREEETELYSNFREDAEALVDDGESVVDREMSATDFARDAYVRSSLGNDIGVVELTFVWEGFAAVEDERVVLGDVFEGGLYLGANQDLVVAPGEELKFAEEPSPSGALSNPDSFADSDSVTWSGERQFTDRRPRVVFKPGTAGGSTPSTEATTTTEPAATTNSPESVGGWSPSEWAIVAALALFAMVAAVRLRDDDRISGGRPLVARGTDGDTDDGGTAPDAPGAAGSGPGSTSESGSAGATAAGTGMGAEAVTSSGAGFDSADPRDPDTAAVDSGPSVPDEELLSDEDRVVSLLHEHGGRMKQNQIVDETGWSKSKVSVLLSEMADGDHLSKLRVGRENVISLDGYEPAATRSPFEEDDET